MKNKMKKSSQWDAIKASEDCLALFTEIKAITFKFKDQKYPVLSVHNAKQEFYTFRQNDLSNANYLQKF